MSSSKRLADRDVAASTLPKLGVAIFAGIGIVVGLGLRWLILRDDSFHQANLDMANFLVATAVVVALGALFSVAVDLVTLPNRRP